MRRSLVTITIVAAAAFGQAPAPRTTPPTVQSVAPRGIARGMTADLTVEGLNLANASAIYFSDPRVKGKILRVRELPDLPDMRLGSNGTRSSLDLGPLPPRNQVLVQVEVKPDAEAGEVSFRLLTPLGTSPVGKFLVEPYFGEVAEKEPNNTPAAAPEALLPAILSGVISKPGDVDLFKFEVSAGRTLVFEDSGEKVGSTLQPVMSILSNEGKVLKTYGDDGHTSGFAHVFSEAGTYFLRIADYEKSGRASHQYRIMAGEIPLASSVFPLGIRKNGTASVQVTGFHVPARVEAKGIPVEHDPHSAMVRVGGAIHPIKVALGDDPEVTVAQPVTRAALPVTLNGRLTVRGEMHTVQFSARKGQQLVFEVMARRLGSNLDPVVEVRTSAGKPIEQATVRPVVETFTTLRDHDSTQPGIRITQWTNIGAGDYMMLGREIVRVDALPRGPDEDIRFEAFGGQRLAFFNTSPEAHANDKAVYKVQLHPPGKQFASNGLPLVRLYAENDDGGPGFGKDSYLRFTSPADGEYQLLLKDVVGSTGAYRLNIREPRPDFRLSVTPRNWNVPLGATIPVTVTALRKDEFVSPIDVEIPGLPAGLSATKATILPNQNSAVLLVSADAQASLSEAIPFQVVGRGGGVERFADPEDRLKLIALTPPADVVMTSETRAISMFPGETATVTVRISRQNGFAGRVPVEVLNMPPRTKLPDFGLNGVLLNEEETERTFQIEATPQAEPGVYTIAVAGRVETRSPQQNQFAAIHPISVTIKARPAVSAVR